MTVGVTRENIAIVLQRPRYPENIGSAARAMAKGIQDYLAPGTVYPPLPPTHLRVQDLDFDRSEVTVRNGKGAKDRVTLLPESLLLVPPDVRLRRITGSPGFL